MSHHDIIAKRVYSQRAKDVALFVLLLPGVSISVSHSRGCIRFACSSFANRLNWLIDGVRSSAFRRHNEVKKLVMGG